MLSVPFQPTEKMIREHEISHLPYRNWCVACVRGRGRSDPHRTRNDNRDEPLFPIISVDYIADQHQPILVLVDRASKSHWAHIVLQKGIGHPYPVAAVLTDLRRSGYKKVIMKSDSENSIVALVTAVQKHWTGELVPEHSPAYESQSNGEIEKANQTIQGLARTLKESLAIKSGYVIPDDSPYSRG